jgi:hypothetical protein
MPACYFTRFSLRYTISLLVNLILIFAVARAVSILILSSIKAAGLCER